MSGYLIDTNVLLDIATADPVWLDWSAEQLQIVNDKGPVLINPIIYAELAPAFVSARALDDWLDSALFQRSPLPYAAGWIASQAWLAYRKGGGSRNSPLPDFYIGAHAEVENLTVVTRDPARYRRYFPKVQIICPV